MGLQIGDTAPDFTAESTEGKISFHDWIGSQWCVFFSHPKDFTPVCTTELGEVARLKAEFARRSARVVALSVDSVADHRGWTKDIEETQQCRVNYPMLADPDRKIAQLYGMIHPQASDTMTVRSVFLIDPAKKIRLMITYPASTGRNFLEILRVLDSLQLADQYKIATPANWQQGQDVIISPSLKDEAQLKQLFPKGYRTVKPYLRYTPQPNR